MAFFFFGLDVAPRPKDTVLQGLLYRSPPMKCSLGGEAMQNVVMATEQV